MSKKSHVEQKFLNYNAIRVVDFFLFLIERVGESVYVISLEILIFLLEKRKELEMMR